MLIATSPTWLSTFRRAPMKYSQNWVGSFSLPSRESQLVGWPQLPTHSLNKLVLPKPAGAEMTVSLWSLPFRSLSSSLGRDTVPATVLGMKNLVVNSCVSTFGAIPQPCEQTTPILNASLVMLPHFGLQIVDSSARVEP